jgi:hypothetical protein
LSNFDKHSKPISSEINKGDHVLYMDSRTRGGQTVKVGLHGTWDGEKVQFKDNEHTVVRNKNWLIKLCS